MHSEKQENLKYECVKCGNCCRAGFEVNLVKEDIERWIKAGKANFCQYIQIDPKCISSTGLSGYHIEELNTLEILQNQYQIEEYHKKIEELKHFIINNHDYLGKGPPLPIYTFLPDLGRNPILIPKTFKILLEGLEWSLVYNLKFETGGYCPFLEENLCSIHEIKPNACRSFPYNKNGKLKVDDFFLKICKGIKFI